MFRARSPTCVSTKVCPQCQGLDRRAPVQTRIPRLDAILLTRVAFATCGGVPGTVLCCAEAAVSNPRALAIVGPPKLGLFMNAVAAYSDYVLQELQLNVQARARQARILRVTF
jgi:hypothetical protein